MKKALIIILAVVLASLQLVQAQQGKMAAMRNKVPDAYDFWLYAPNEYYDYPDDLFPVIIFLHGQSLCGRDMNRSLKYGVMEAISMGRHVEAMVITPQNPGGSWNPEKISSILDWVIDHYRVDPCKVYVLGMSLGGYGTMDFVGTYPEKVTAAMALCGGCTLKDVQGLGRVPFWIIHGTADEAIPISQSKRVVEELKEAGNDRLLRYDWLPGVNHGRPARIFYLVQTYEWFSMHDKERNPYHVNRRITISLDDMNNAYKGLNTRGNAVDRVSNLEP